MKFFQRILSALLALALMLTACAALADTPKPIEALTDEEVPEPLKGQHHYLLLCVDQWNKPMGNTDGMVLVTLDTRQHRVMLTSFIRDALVQRPDGHIGRINYIAKNYSPEELCSVISRHIGVKVEKYILFNFSQIQSIINYLGGVDITIDDSEATYLTRYAIPKDSTKPRIRGAGTYHFNGHSAVIYMRIRKASGRGDFMRTQRVRTVLSTLAQQCREITEADARKLVDAVLENSSRTNMNVDDMVNAMTQAYGLRTCTMEELRIPPDDAVQPIQYAGMAAQQVDWAACRQEMANYLENSFLVLDETEDYEESIDDLDMSVDW